MRASGPTEEAAQELEAARAELAGLRASDGARTQQAIEADRRAEKLAADLESLRAERDRLLHEVQDVRSALAAHSADAERLVKEHEQLKAGHQAVSRDKEQIQAHLANLIEARDGTNSDFENACDRWENERQAGQARFDHERKGLIDEAERRLKEQRDRAEEEAREARREQQAVIDRLVAERDQARQDAESATLDRDEQARHIEALRARLELAEVQADRANHKDQASPTAEPVHGSDQQTDVDELACQLRETREANERLRSILQVFGFSESVSTA